MTQPETAPRRVAILGSTGSIGTQALEVMAALPGHFVAEVLTAQSKATLLIEQAIAHKPNCVVIGDKEKYRAVADALQPHDIKVYAGREALMQVVEMESIDIVLTALVGYAGLEPTLHAIEHKKPIALANKETLVVAGELVTETARKHNVNIYPVDSEHSAIFQCMAGEWHNPIEKVILTASGGPFRGRDAAFLRTVTKADALNHPNWAMGAKITIDSATLMNKGLEMIEARWLFNLRTDQVEVIVHPQSVIHSMVQFEDGSIKAQMGIPDMKLPIQYALGYPQRIANSFPRFDFTRYPQLTFEQADTKTFRNLALAIEAMQRGGNAPCVLNAVNEVAVDAFLKDKITFAEIPDIIESCLAKTAFVSRPALHDYIESDRATRQAAFELTTT